MSSLQKSFAVNTKGLPDIQYVGGPYYTADATPEPDLILLFPFTFKNDTLDIQYINGFTSEYSTAPLTSSSIPNSGGLARRLGGLNLVQKIGPNFLHYIKSVTWEDYPSGPTYTVNSASVYKPGLVTKVQQLSHQNLPNSIDPDKSYISSSEPPDTDFTLELTSGYGSSYVFEKPLVIIANTTVGTRYITFYTSWDF
jgi:hypothetical protein